MIEDQKQYEDKYKRNIIEKQLPECCKQCSGFLNITDLDKQTVYCPNLVHGECMLQAYINVQKEKKK